MEYKVPLLRPSLPDKQEYLKIIDELWDTRLLSNFGKYANKMEEKVKQLFNSNLEFRTVVSCDIGLILALKAFEFEQGSEVIVQSFTFNSTPNVILWNNLKPVFVDINRGDFCIDLDDVEKKITNKTVAIMATHIFGNTANLNKLQDIASKYNLKLIFDSAHAFGSMYNGKHVCEYGDAGVFSFSGTKLITSAEGGLAYFKDKSVADKFLLMRQYGFNGDYNTKVLGMNGKISEFHASLAYLAISDLKKCIEKRQIVSSYYKSHIKNVEFQKVSPETTSTYKDFAILTEDRDRVYDKLNSLGVQTKKYFFPNHYTDYYKNLMGSIYLKNTEEVYSKILCIPIFNDISQEQIDYVIGALNG